jgi:hypothetical protein
MSSRHRCERYGPDDLSLGVHRLMESPEAFVLCERLGRARSWLAKVWVAYRDSAPSS